MSTLIILICIIIFIVGSIFVGSIACVPKSPYEQQIHDKAQLTYFKNRKNHK